MVKFTISKYKMPAAYKFCSNRLKFNYFITKRVGLQFFSDALYIWSVAVVSLISAGASTATTDDVLAEASEAVTSSTVGLAVGVSIAAVVLLGLMAAVLIIVYRYVPTVCNTLVRY